MSHNMIEKRNKVIDRLIFVSKKAENHRSLYLKALQEKNKSDKQYHRSNQIRYEKRLFTAESSIDRLNDKLGFERGDYKKH